MGKLDDERRGLRIKRKGMGGVKSFFGEVPEGEKILFLALWTQRRFMIE